MKRFLRDFKKTSLDSWLQSADAFLIPMVFEEKYRRRMETSFPSKLIEFAQFGKPLVVWGPEYCSAVQWSRVLSSALCIASQKPRDLVESLEILAESASMQKKIGFCFR
jgi:hypothetical protein